MITESKKIMNFYPYTHLHSSKPLGIELLCELYLHFTFLELIQEQEQKETLLTYSWFLLYVLFLYENSRGHHMDNNKLLIWYLVCKSITNQRQKIRYRKWSYSEEYWKSQGN